jgi:hypothetical protein
VKGIYGLVVRTKGLRNSLYVVIFVGKSCLLYNPLPCAARSFCATLGHVAETIPQHVSVSCVYQNKKAFCGIMMTM